MKTLITSLCLTATLLGAGKPQGYTLETHSLPKGAVTVLGVCHKPDGTLAVASWEGEVWELKDGTWSLFAEDLMEPNGIYYDQKEDAYYVAQKPELTRLKDTDKDGKCDLYECVTSTFGVTGEYHEYHYGPVVDSQGRKYATLNLAAAGNENFFLDDGKGPGGNMRYSGDYRGWIYRSDRMGHFHPIASGLRSPAGVGVSPQDEIFVTDNQGDWVADSCMYHIEEGKFYLQPASLLMKEEYSEEQLKGMTAADFALLKTAPAIWFPRTVIANSPGSPVWDTTGGKFGPFSGQIFCSDQAQSNYFRCGTEEVNGTTQGWCVDFYRGTESGGVKLSWAPDGSLWSAQVGRGWRSQGGKRTALQQLKWDGETTPFEIHNASLTETGFKVSFTERIGKMTTPEIKSWHYHYWSTYGCNKVMEETLPVTDYTLSEDRKSITFNVPLSSGRVYAINLKDQKNTDGELLGNNTIYYTVNALRNRDDRAVDLLATDGFDLNEKWEMKGNVLTPSETPGGILWSKKSYENFTVTLAYKTSPQCNSGLFFRTDPRNPVQGGFEIQIASPGLYQGKHVVGSLYDAKEPLKTPAKPDGQWNTMTVTCMGSRVIATLNGHEVQSVNLNEWKTPNQNPDGSKNKFETALRDLPQKGHLGLQYHGHPVEFRSITVKEW